MIELLSQNVIDQIAAGEVVERPSHLVKELIENSIDANADEIQIEFSDGGKFIKIKDNGMGMTNEDLAKALDRYATSKIHQFEDVWKLKTFGFRGEALASISAVSEMTITTKTQEQNSASKLVSRFGVREEIVNSGGDKGTLIVVDKLFENTPVRLKFLKSTGAEHTNIKTTLKALALAHPQVQFRIIESGKLIYFFEKTSDRLERAKQVFEIQNLYVSESKKDHVSAYVVYASPHDVNKTSKNIWLFAQNRWVQDRGMQAATMDAYRNLLMHGEYPTVAVWVACDSDFIDVNIHPTKSQVKFQNSSDVFRAVHAALRAGLESAPWITTKHSELKVNFEFATTQGTDLQSMQNSEYAIKTQDQTFAQPQLGLNTEESPKPQNYSDSSETNYNFTGTHFKSKSFVRSDNSSENQYQKISMSDLKSLSVSKEDLQIKYWGSLQVLAQANLTYIVCQSGDKLIFVDQHAAHERVVFEKLIKHWMSGKLETQEFLFPLTFDFSSEKIESLQSVSSEFLKFGVEFELLGPTTIGIKSCPPIIKEESLGPALELVANEILEHGGSYSLEKIMKDVVARMACHSSVRAGQSLSIEEMQELLKSMDEFPLSSFCPHGRTVSVEYPFARLEKEFGRVL